MRVWDAASGKFISQSRYAELEAERTPAWDPNALGELDDVVEARELAKSGLTLKGGIIIKGELAVTIANHLGELGYKDVGSQYGLMVVLPEDRTYDNFVEEALYWYLRQVGIDLGK